MASATLVSRLLVGSEGFILSAGRLALQTHRKLQ